MYKNLVSTLALLLGCALSVTGFQLVRRAEHRELEGRLQKIADDRVELLRTEILRSMEVLHAIESLYASSEWVSREQFREFVCGARNRQPEIQALEWVAKVPAESRDAFERGVRAEAFPDFRITEQDGEQLVPASRRACYFPVAFVEPMSGNEAAFGFDTNSNPRRHEALDRALASGVAAATAAVRLAQEKGEQLGFLVFQPLYRGGPDHAFAGFAVAVFRVGTLVETALRPLKARDISVAVYDSAVPDFPIYSQSTERTSAPLQRSGKELRWMAGLDIAARHWEVEILPGKEFLAINRGHVSWMVLGTGVLFSVLVAAYLRGVQRQSAEIEARVREKTAALSLEIAERSRAEERLRSARDDLETRVAERTAELAKSNGALVAEVEIRKRAEEHAAAANLAKSVFLTNMSHEIRTPMNVILGYSQILERDAALHPFQRDAVTTIASSCHHLLNLVDGILDLGKIEAGKMELSLKEFDLVSLAREMAAMFQQRCEEKGVGLHVQWLGQGDRVPVKGDEGKLRQVLINLLGNAVKFTDTGTVSLRIAAEGSGCIRFETIDTGIGVNPEALARIFEPFSQEPGAHNRGGTGLGLAIARRHVELMGGELRAVSEPLKGSRFFFSIPLQQAPEAFSRSSSIRKNEPVVKALAPNSRVNALVVDDIRENRDVLSQLLLGIGCRVATAADGPSALELIALSRPDIVFMDMRLPGMSGLEASQRIISRFGPDAMKIVSMSAGVLESEREAYFRAGCDDFIGKPILIGRLHQCLRNLLNVEFEYETAPDEDEGPGIDLAQIALPEDLVLRLSMAAELHSATVLKACLAELRTLGPAEQRLAEHLRQFMGSYDMTTILKIVSQIPVQGSPQQTR